MRRKKPTIMIVDDEEQLRRSLSDYLGARKFRVLEAGTAEEAIETLQSESPDLVILDVKMPGIGGLGFLRKMEDADGHFPFPIIALTAHARLEEFFSAVSVDAFFAKPVDLDELSSSIRQILARRAAAASRASRARKLVLLAETEPSVAASYEQMMVTHGYDVVLVDTGPAVLETAPTLRPDVIVMREILPDLNGSAVARLISRMPTLRQTDIVLYYFSSEQVPRSHDLDIVKAVVAYPEDAGRLVSAIDDL
jgi:DNA-binding response OmpR family regulator